MAPRDPPEDPAGGPLLRRVLLRCAAEEVALPLDRIEEVLMPQSLTRIPGTGPEVCGLIGLRGRVLTVFDLCALLGKAPLVPGTDHRILVVRAADRTVGLIVGAVGTIDEGGGPVREDAAAEGPAVLDLDRLIRPKLA